MASSFIKGINKTPRIFGAGRLCLKLFRSPSTELGMDGLPTDKLKILPKTWVRRKGFSWQEPCRVWPLCHAPHPPSQACWVQHWPYLLSLDKHKGQVVWQEVKVTSSPARATHGRRQGGCPGAGNAHQWPDQASPGTRSHPPPLPAVLQLQLSSCPAIWTRRASFSSLCWATIFSAKHKFLLHVR